ncbi:MAG: YncE family protein, partial [Candidatus Eremiobacteraeota bacterium]|nr:YncE family protein [Candidatus Eremiobacteraeota bacterium]
PPQPVAGTGGFDYVTVAAAHRRVYAAHGGAASLLIVDADSGKVIGQVKVGDMAGSAPDPVSGNVYTGDGDDKALSEVDPAALKELHRVSVDGPVDAIAYDASNGRIYGDEDDGTRIFVIDAKTFKQVATIPLPGHKPEYLVIDPQTHEVYQNIADASEVAVIDPATLKVARTFKTPELTNNHPLQADWELKHLFVGGANGKLSEYTLDGQRLWTIDVPRMDQCSIEVGRKWIACAGSGKLTLISYDGKTSPKIVAQADVSMGVHTVNIDPKTGDIWIVWGTPRGATTGNGSVQRFKYQP